MLVGTRVPRGMVWSAPTPKERWRVWWRGIAASPGSYVRAGVSAGVGQMGNTPQQYGQGWDAYSKRYGNSFLTYTLQDSASQALAAAIVGLGVLVAQGIIPLRRSRPEPANP